MEKGKITVRPLSDFGSLVSYTDDEYGIEFSYEPNFDVYSHPSVVKMWFIDRVLQTNLKNVKKVRMIERITNSKFDLKL